MFKRFRITPDSSGIIRSVGISSLAIALCVYAMTIQPGGATYAALSATVLLIAAGGALQVSRAVRQLRRQHDQLRQATIQSERHYFKVLRRIMAAIEAREHYTRGRSKRIGFMAKRIGERLGLNNNQCHLLYMAGQVHDIGLLAVPDYILNKASRLGSEEFHTVHRHPETSYRILQPLTSLEGILPAVRFHHERMNGTGYPHELTGEQIPLSARILAVADAYDAMTHDRPFRTALPPIEALNELRRCSPAGYDEQCVAALEEITHLRNLMELHRPDAKAAPEPVQTS